MIEDEGSIVNDADDLASTRVWRAVVAQAFSDAGGDSTVHGPQKERARTEAREWLSKPSDDLQYVCDLAGLDMEKVIKFATIEIAKADAKPRKARQGGRKRLITFDDCTRSLSEWAAVVGITPLSLATRLKKGWSIEKALTTPAPGGGSRLSPEAKAPADPIRSRSDENRVSEKEAA